MGKWKNLKNTQRFGEISKWLVFELIEPRISQNIWIFWWINSVVLWGTTSRRLYALIVQRWHYVICVCIRMWAGKWVCVCNAVYICGFRPYFQLTRHSLHHIIKTFKQQQKKLLNSDNNRIDIFTTRFAQKKKQKTKYTGNTSKFELCSTFFVYHEKGEKKTNKHNTVIVLFVWSGI